VERCYDGKVVNLGLRRLGHRFGIDIDASFCHEEQYAIHLEAVDTD
jgi:hypothetical protein